MATTIIMIRITEIFIAPLPLGGAPDYSTDTESEFHAEAHRQLRAKDLPSNAQSPHVASGARFESTTLQLKDVDSTNAPLRPTNKS